MTSLKDVYHRRTGAVASRRRVSQGLTLFAIGAGLIALGIVLGTTSIGEKLGLGVYASREWAGIFAGIGIPSVFVGLFSILPTNRVTRAAAAIGASLSIFGVALFTHAYPTNWPGAPGANPLLALLTLAVYFLGTIITSWCLFVAVATFKTRKSPGGTAEMRVTESGTIKLVKESADGLPGLGGIGLFGSGPNMPTETVSTRDRNERDRTASDGGSVTKSNSDDQFGGTDTIHGQPDRYCGNCAHFHYVRKATGLEPYCDHTDEYLDDMEACGTWDANEESADTKPGA